MDVYPAATATMNSPTRVRAPRDLDDAVHQRRANNSHFDSHDDFYNFLDSNKGPPGPANPNAGVTMQAAMPPQSATAQQRLPHAAQPNQSRPPVTNSFPNQRPPSYSGSRSEEMLVDKNPAAVKVQRQNGRRQNTKPPPTGARPTTRAGSPPSTWSPNASPNHPNQQGRPTSSGEAALEAATAAAAAAASIQRLKSPSVMNCVLQPLDQKVQEYDDLMRREEEQMARLDEELRVLQERRSETEARFLEAKSKHDDYRRQYLDVERAMRGEPPLPREPSMQQQQQQQQHQPFPPQQTQHQPPPPQQQMHRMSIHDDEDDDDELDMRHTYHRRINSQQSFGRSSQKKRDRFRFSLFGGDR
ncbi:hypothetical protein F4775DRAFT_103117 [Biscogniauxia sp. FL1348]|nr:hypothetical protein F4775DRAFT_103117 [Biscogniauxia sp. FL1348]